MNEIISLRAARKIIEEARFSYYSEFGSDPVWEILLHAGRYLEVQMRSALVG